MAYQIFALKWRPQSFEQIIGQNHAVGLLANSIQRNRLAFAYLFAGPRGVGKTSTARILAKSLNCKNGPTITPCQVCTCCQEITQCRSLDVLEIDGASNRGIDEIRALREGVRFAPASGRFKIYIIDEVHMLTNEAFNALLKTLEEPPEFVKFIFATTQVNRIPATILSRCQRLDFRRIPMLDIIKQLKKIISQEKMNLEDEVLFIIARACDGSLRDAESILDQLISFTQGNKISTCDVSSLLGVLEQQALFEITDKIISKDALGALDILNVMLKQGKDAGIILNNLIEHFRNLIIAKISGADPRLIDFPAETAKKLLEQSRSFSLEEILGIFNLLVNTKDMSKKMDSSVIPLEINLIRIIQEKKISTAPANREKPGFLKNSREVKTVSVVENKALAQDKQKQEQREKTEPPEAQLKQENNLGSATKETPNDAECYNGLKQHWSRIIDNLSKIKMSVATFLSEGTPLKLEGNILTISFPNSCSLHKDILEKKENRLLIEQALSQFLKQDFKLKFVLSLSAPVEKKAEHKSIKDSCVHSAMDIFNARLI